VKNITTLAKLFNGEANKNYNCIHGLHNFIRDSALDDELFAQCDANEDFLSDVDKVTTYLSTTCEW
jgi:hypothetical protein